MYARHFLKMLLGLVGMAVIGIGGLLVANHYSKGDTASVTTVAPAVKTTTTGKTAPAPRKH